MYITKYLFQIVVLVVICLTITACENFVYFIGTCTEGDCTNGQGTLTFRSGWKYVGEFKDGLPNGQGTITWPVGDKYVGGIKDGKGHGHGTMIWANGKKYVGGFKDGEYHGQGTLTFTNGRVKHAIWKNNRIDKLVR
jgi:hypothetical protein